MNEEIIGAVCLGIAILSIVGIFACAMWLGKHGAPWNHKIKIQGEKTK